MCNCKSSSTHWINRIILDGEMLVWDPVSERNLPFGTLKTAARGACFVLFLERHLTLHVQTSPKWRTVLDHVVGGPISDLIGSHIPTF